MVDWDEVIGWAQTQAYAEDLIRTELAGKDLQGADITWWVRHKLSDAAVAVEAEGVYAFDWPTRRRIAAERLAEQWHMVRDSQTALASTIVEQARTEARYEYMQRALVTPGDHVVMDNLHLARLESSRPTSRASSPAGRSTGPTTRRSPQAGASRTAARSTARARSATRARSAPPGRHARAGIPGGHPEYAAYAAELRAELAKWAVGDGELIELAVQAAADGDVLEVERAAYFTGDFPIITLDEISAA